MFQAFYACYAALSCLELFHASEGRLQPKSTLRVFMVPPGGEPVTVVSVQNDGTADGLRGEIMFALGDRLDPITFRWLRFLTDARHAPLSQYLIVQRTVQLAFDAAIAQGQFGFVPEATACFFGDRAIK